MNLPSLTNRTFINLERKLGEDLEEIVTPELIVAGEEKWTTVEKGYYSENIPSITVVVDAGWSKRNANSGVVVILDGLPNTIN